jgi:hypothetical protein
MLRTCVPPLTVNTSVTHQQFSHLQRPHVSRHLARNHSFRQSLPMIFHSADTQQKRDSLTTTPFFKYTIIYKTTI